MPSEPAATLRSRYVEQAASDLEENRRRQRELTEKIRMLKQEEALLTDILSLTERFPESADTPPLPEQAQDEPSLAREKPSLTSDTSKSSGHERSGTRTQGHPRSRTATAKGKSRRPLLGDLLMELLARHDDPRAAKQLRDELLEKHPQRTPTPQVVRNTLESLVAKGRIQRHKQHRSVMYTLVRSEPQRTAADRG